MARPKRKDQLFGTVPSRPDMYTAPTGPHLKPEHPHAGMLVLTRKKDESVMIGDIEVKVVDVKGGKVKLGIKAPKEVIVDRREIYLEKQAEEAGAHDNSNSTVSD